MEEDSSENYGTVGFEYVVDKNVRSPISFGTKLEREVMPTRGPNLSSYMRYLGLEEKPSSKIMTYVARPVSKGVMVSFKKEPRWSTSKPYQPPHRPMSPPPPKRKTPYVPFNSKLYRTSTYDTPVPGPGMYNPSKKKMRIKFHHSFGGNKILCPAVDIKCVPINYDTCAKCSVNCGEQGDYWHRDNKTFLCRACYELLYKRLLNRPILESYVAIRDCSFAHYHQRSKNAIKLIGTSEIKKRILKDAYLSLFFSNVQDLKYNPGIEID